MRRLARLGLIVIGFFCVTSAVAGSLGDFADQVMGPVSGLGKIMHAMFFVAGIGFLLGGLLQYKYHRENPQQVRISTPLILVGLGIIILLVPIFTLYSGSGNFIS